MFRMTHKNIRQVKHLTKTLRKRKYVCTSTGVLISPKPDQEGTKLIFLSEWREFPSASCRAGKKNLMTAHVSMLLKSLASLTRFRACFIPGRAKDLSAPRYYGCISYLKNRIFRNWHPTDCGCTC